MSDSTEAIFVAGWDDGSERCFRHFPSLEGVRNAFPEVFGGYVCDWFVFSNLVHNVESEGNYHSFFLLRLTANGQVDRAGVKWIDDVDLEDRSTLDPNWDFEA